VITLNAAKTLLEMFKGYNVEYIFGLPGETTLPLYKEWVSTPEIKHVMMRDERSAAFAADAYSRFAFAPGICESPSVGSTHIIPGIAEAFKAGIPMIALTSDIPLHFEKRNMLTGINQTSLLESITKESITITDAKEIPNIIRRSFRICTTGKPGPVHIRFPSDKQKEEIIDPDLNIQKDFRKYPGHRSVAELTKISEALKILGSAERPVLICGQGVLMSQAWDEVISFAELFGLPVGTTINGKGSFPETHPLSIGVVGARGGTSFSNKLVNEADVLLYIGCSTDSAGTDSWKIPPPDTKARIIHLDISEAEVGNNYQTEVFLIGDAKATLRVIKEVAEKQEKKRRSLTRIKLIQKEATEYYEYVNSFNSSNDLPIHPVKLVNELSEALPKNYALVSDVGVSAIYTATYFKVKEAGRKMLYNYAMGSLGYAIPASVGIHFARPDLSIATLVGDGSFGFTAGELETIARLGGSNHIILFNNLSYGWIRAEWQLSYGKEYVDFATNFKPVDYLKIAEGFGLKANRINKPNELKTLKNIFNDPEPTFTEIVVESEDKLVPPVPTWIQKAQKNGLKYVK